MCVGGEEKQGKARILQPGVLLRELGHEYLRREEGGGGSREDVERE